jgi:predicted secreted protein
MALDTSKIQYGGDLMLFTTLSGTTAQPIAFSSAAKLDVTMKTRDIGSKDSGYWDEKAAGKLSWNMSTDALMADSNLGDITAVYSELYTSMIARLPITVAFATATGTAPAWTISAVAGKKKFSGLAYITSLSLNAPDGDNASYSISLEGTGALTMA